MSIGPGFGSIDLEDFFGDDEEEEEEEDTDVGDVISAPDQITPGGGAPTGQEPTFGGGPPSPDDPGIPSPEPTPLPPIPSPPVDDFIPSTVEDLIAGPAQILSSAVDAVRIPSGVLYADGSSSTEGPLALDVGVYGMEPGDVILGVKFSGIDFTDLAVPVPSDRPVQIELSGINNVENRVSSALENAQNNLTNRLPTAIRLAALQTDITNPSAVDRNLNTLRNLNNITISGQSVGSLPRNIRVIDDLSVSLKAGGSTVPGPDIHQVDFTIGADFTPIKVPTELRVGGQTVFTRDLISNLPDISIDVTVEGAGGIFGFGGEPDVTATVEIPPRAYAEAVTVDISCENIVNALDIGSRVQNGRAQEAINRLESLKDEIQNELGIQGVSKGRLSEALPTTQSRIQRNIGQNLGGDRINRLRNRAENEWREELDDIPLPEGVSLDRFNIPSDIEVICEGTNAFENLSVGSRAADLKSNINRFLNAFTNVLEQVRLGCAEEFISEHNQLTSLEEDVNNFVRSGPRAPTRSAILSQIFELENQIDQNVSGECASQFRSRLQSARSRIEGRTREGPIDRVQEAVDCAEIAPPDLQNDINSYIANARSFTRRREIERTEDRFNELVNRGQELNQRIENEFAESECIQEFQSKLNSARSRLQSAGPRREGIVPCGQRHSDIDQQVDDFEDRISNLTAPIEPETLQQVTSQAQDLIGNIEANMEPGRCSQEFVDRIRSATNVLEGFQERVQVRVVEERGEGAEESLNQLIEQINRIEVRQGGVSGGGIRNRREFL